jgi:hypothetical protein
MSVKTEALKRYLNKIVDCIDQINTPTEKAANKDMAMAIADLLPFFQTRDLDEIFNGEIT